MWGRLRAWIRQQSIAVLIAVLAGMLFLPPKTAVTLNLEKWMEKEGYDRWLADHAGGTLTMAGNWIWGVLTSDTAFGVTIGMMAFACLSIIDRRRNGGRAAVPAVNAELEKARSDWRAEHVAVQRLEAALAAKDREVETLREGNDQARTMLAKVEAQMAGVEARATDLTAQIARFKKQAAKPPQNRPLLETMGALIDEAVRNRNEIASQRGAISFDAYQDDFDKWNERVLEALRPISIHMQTLFRTLDRFEPDYTPLSGNDGTAAASLVAIWNEKLNRLKAIMARTPESGPLP